MGITPEDINSRIVHHTELTRSGWESGGDLQDRASLIQKNLALQVISDIIDEIEKNPESVLIYIRHQIKKSPKESVSLEEILLFGRENVEGFNQRLGILVKRLEKGTRNKRDGISTF